MQPYRPRPVRPLDVLNHQGWRFKRYAITTPADPFDVDRFTGGFQLAMASLPASPVTAERPGVGFLIAHQGRGADYVVLGWWDRENELPLRVFVRAEGEGWRGAREGEGACVWDLEVVWHERQAYVDTVLSVRLDDSGRVPAYLGRRLSITPEAALPRAFDEARLGV